MNTDILIPWWGAVGIAVLFIYLIATDIKLHRRVKRLEHIIASLEGVNDTEKEDTRTEDFGG